MIYNGKIKVYYIANIYLFDIVESKATTDTTQRIKNSLSSAVRALYDSVKLTGMRFWSIM